ncbi:MAG TPA: hypothetical protein VKK61_02475, partial [Tepidisphaeraceae bacterium]|nr:hypothetical protein [Tepidisphaeraceae bacterium]
MRRFVQMIIGVLGLFCLTASFAFADDKINPSQLVGSWVHVGAADMQALEFTKDGKLLVYYGGGNDAMTADYSIMDDGRLNFSMGGQSNFFLPTVSGDRLQLKQPETGNVSQYRRLKSGETIAAAITAQDQADQKAVQVRSAALPDFLKRADLVMLVDGGGANVPASSAIAFAPAGNDYAGHICYDSKPPRVEAVTAQIQGSADNPIAVISFPQNPNLGQVSFRLAGTAPDISLTAAVNFGGTFDNAPNHTAIIKSNPDMHKQILDQLKSEVDRLNALRTPVIAMLKDYAVLKGVSQSMTPAQRSDDEFVLSRNPQNGTWVGQGQSVNHTTGATEIFPVMASVGIVDQKPAIQIISQKRLYRFTEIDTTGGKMNGAWQMPNNPNGYPAQMAIMQAIDAKARDQLFAASKTALQQMGSAAVFHAIINDQYTNGAQPPNPLTVTLTASAGGAITGKAEYPLEGCTMNLSGKEVDTPLGP